MRNETGTAYGFCIELIGAPTDIDIGLLTGHLEMIVALLQRPPEGHVRVFRMHRHVFRRHAEREGLNLECFLTGREGIAGKRINLLDLIVLHGIAAR